MLIIYPKNMKFIFFVFLLSLTAFTNISFAESNPQQSTSLLYLHDESYSFLANHFAIDKQFSLDIQSRCPSSISSYEGIILIDYVPSSVEMIRLESFVQSGGGIFLFVGPSLTNNASFLQLLNLTTSSMGQVVDHRILPTISKVESPLTNLIEWNSVPVIYNSTRFGLNSNVRIIVDDKENNALIFESTDNNVVVITIWPEEIHNAEFIQWPYFNYLIFLSEMQIKGVSDERIPIYADWAYSPVPHLSDTIFIGIGVIITSLITLIGFISARKYSRSNIIRQEDLEAMSEQISVNNEWEEVGMHRQISGFLVQLFIGMLIILPNAIMTSLVFPLIILPSPQAAGFYDFTLRFFEALWLIFDLGTATVLVKFFSEHRVERPQRAIRYVQIFIWYQMISGIMQLFLISFLGSFIFPRTFLAHMSWVFVTHAFFQWPAFFIVFMLLFRAMNRIDFHQILNILLYGVFNITLQYLVIVIFRVVLGTNIIFGDSLAGAIGYSVGNYAVRLATFAVGLWMFKRLGFSVKNLFRVDFSWIELKESLTFGIKWAFGNMWVPLGWFLQVFLLAMFLPNYTEQQGFFSIAFGFAGIVQLVGLFAESMLGGVSEAYHSKRKVLTQYYAVTSLKWAAFFDFFFVAVLMAIGPRFILGGAGEEWSGAAILIPFILIFHAFGYLSWLGDWMFAGSDRPGWAAISWIIEQGVRAGLLLIFIPQYQFFADTFNSPLVGIMFAYIPALIIKDIYMWWGIRKSAYFKFKWKDLAYPGIVAPILTAFITYGITEILSSFIWQGEIITSVIILLLGTFPMIYLHSFIYGFLGGFDKNTLAEFRKAAYMSSGISILSRLLYKAAVLGTKISPLHDRFPISIYEEAAEEAKTLTQEKKVLVI
ncbi:MAG: hypothetical protein EAX86_12850 [Candidatus Heimdallarchaeota archaeon]|nr:hypothetical protein [Candidatus Heimdallarchaeota archaeon]